ncbi:hypothetical protein F5883DRAFT_656008 [Diaporthe sp. PMI_573]|nr:hypothetical protein F5883DRAFT_656008 [Diaporthaceae sp. PMI_573]
MTVLWGLFIPSWGQWVSAFGTAYGMVSNYIDPLTWFSRGVLSAALPEAVVHCAEIEFARFDHPAGQTCVEYAGQFLWDVVMDGYLQDQNVTSDCGYCAYNDGTEYMRVLNVEGGHV